MSLLNRSVLLAVYGHFAIPTREPAAGCAPDFFCSENLGTPFAFLDGSYTDQTMAKLVEYRGLCSTCESDERCALRANQKEPAIYCEQFQCEGARPNEASSEPQTPRANARAKVLEDNRFIGLCADCEDRAACSLSNADGGVWHCEEYR